METIFISYSRHDSNIALDFADGLRREGFTVWIDVSNIPGGAVWHYEIETAITNCDLFLIMISGNAKDSEWVRREMIFALNLKKRIIPVRLEKIELPLALCELQPIDYFANPIRTLQGLRAAIGQHSARSSVPPQPSASVTADANADGLSLVDFRRHLLTHLEHNQTTEEL